MDDNEVVKGEIHANGQLTVPKTKREEIGIEEHDTVYYIIIKVITKNGMVRYSKKKKEVKNG